MATSSAALIRDGLRHPVRSLIGQLSKWAEATPGLAAELAVTAVHRCQSPERLERIAAYARVGYFHMEYTAGMFVVPLEIPPE
ncbi:hypothetical protein [Paraburkholderia sp. DHOC27]|uniref:hypothetical protein n=1 Tax=Paraburkholderia sp. DHOC27 TaxID=2303330 RepID=UPI000E3B8D7E|nr:hypothetical protein [Paraburkholderia sp. DHOC27]RFU45066.1 hypothetical protein D0B32_25340 [Paraburkholderia sp. DHOC27]